MKNDKQIMKDNYFCEKQKKKRVIASIGLVALGKFVNFGNQELLFICKHMGNYLIFSVYINSKM